MESNPDSGVGSEDVGMIQIRLITKQPQYAVPDVPMAAPVSLSPPDLNNLVNNLIEDSQIAEPKAVEFEFLIGAELLRTSLKEHLEAKELSTETVLVIEYLERLPAPKPQDCLLHDDWVSSVHTRGSFILSGAYDGSTHIWTDAGVAVVNVTGHKGAVKAVAWASQSGEGATFLLAGQEQTSFLWRWNRESGSTACLAAYRGHERSIESLAVSPDGAKFASVGWDGFLKLWSLADGPDNSEPASKKSKRSTGDGLLSSTPEMTLKGHRDCVSCVRWQAGADILTCSWDQTLRLWDVQEGGMKQEMAGNKAFLSCDVSLTSGLILATSADKHVRLFDPRSTEGSVVKQTFTSHTAWVQSTRWCPKDDTLFMSGGQDHMLKLWDTRSPRAPLYEMSGHTDKVLCCDWSEPALMVSGGADSAVRVFAAPVK